MTVFLGYMSLSANMLVLDNDTQVIIEMQVLNHEGLEKRILYNQSCISTALGGGLGKWLCRLPC